MDERHDNVVGNVTKQKAEHGFEDCSVSCTTYFQPVSFNHRLDNLDTAIDVVWRDMDRSDRPSSRHCNLRQHPTQPPKMVGRKHERLRRYCL